MISEQILISLSAVLFLGAALLFAAWLVRAPSTTSSGLNVLMQVAGWSLIAVSVVVLWSLAMNIVGGLITWTLTFVVAVMIFHRVRLARQDELLSVIALCVEREMPLEPVLTGLSHEFHGLSQARLRRLVIMLRNGVWLPDALGRVRNLISPRALVAVRVGSASGHLATALNDATRARSFFGAPWNALMGRAALLFCTLVMALGVGALGIRYVYPKIQAVLNDFGLANPFGILSVGPLGSTPEFWLTLAVVEFFTVLGLGVFVIAFVVYLGWVPILIPLGPLARIVETGPLLRHLALLAESSQPLARGLSILGSVYPYWTLRRRLRHAAQMVETGASLADSLEQARLVSHGNAALIRSAQQVGNLPWSLRMIADAADRRLYYRLQAAAQVLLPVALAMLGLVVAFMALSLYVPLTQLIWSLAP